MGFSGGAIVKNLTITDSYIYSGSNLGFIAAGSVRRNGKRAADCSFLLPLPPGTHRVRVRKAVSRRTDQPPVRLRIARADRRSDCRCPAAGERPAARSPEAP